MEQICQSSLPFAPWLHGATWRLPGIQPLEMADWLVVDEVFAAQMAERERLLAGQRDQVFQPGDGAAGRAAAELLALILGHLGPGYSRQGDHVTRPDGVQVALGDAPPLLVAARLVQEDLCILQKPEGGAEHALSAAALCFPASWTLAEKLGHPLSAIHSPVAPYDAQMARRVQRMFDMLRPEQPLWRANALFYADAALHQPRTVAAPRARPSGQPPFLRSERQSLLKLAETGAVVFSIHTWVVPYDRLDAEQRAGLDSAPVETAGAKA